MAHTIEVAKSSRAACQSCRAAIPKGELRFGEEAANQFDADATSYRWHHLKCAASKLSNELASALKTFVGEVPDREELDKLMAEAAAKAPPPFPYADRAPTGRASCQGCGDPIPKGSLRVAFEREIERGMSVTKGAGYLHPKCAAGHIESLGGNHADLTEGIRQNTRGMSDTDLDAVLAEV